MDIVGPLPPTQGMSDGFMIVVIDHYTKCVETEAYVNITMHYAVVNVETHALLFQNT